MWACLKIQESSKKNASRNFSAAKKKNWIDWILGILGTFPGPKFWVWKKIMSVNKPSDWPLLDMADFQWDLPAKSIAAYFVTQFFCLVVITLTWRQKNPKVIHLKFRILHVGISTDGSLGDGLVGAGILGEKCVGVFISRIRFQTACRKKKITHILGDNDWCHCQPNTHKKQEPHWFPKVYHVQVFVLCVFFLFFSGDRQAQWWITPDTY